MRKRYLNRLEYLDFLIRTKATGNPRVLARKLNISKRTVFEYIDLLKSLEAPIAYDRHQETYYYAEMGNFNFKFIKNRN